VLVGVRIPPNYGRDYTERFFGMFADVARERKASLAPFLLDGFADQTDLFQNDRIHPTVRAQQKMLDNVWPHLQPLLETRGTVDRGSRCCFVRAVLQDLTRFDALLDVRSEGEFADDHLPGAITHRPARRRAGRGRHPLSPGFTV